MLKKEIKDLLQAGTVIPAHPLALNVNRSLDEPRQKRLTQYYLASGAGGVAVGVHTTQFEIRDDNVKLFEPVLRLASETVEEAEMSRPFIKVAGIVGPTDQAIQEAQIAASYNYDMGLLSMGGLDNYSEAELIRRAQKIGEIIPLVGFYLQPTVGGRLLSYDFWKQFAEIPAVHAIKIAPFNRYQTLDVVRAVCSSSRYNQIALYTGNDDNIIADLLTTYRFDVNGERREKSIVGGLLGQWAVWTKKAVGLLQKVKSVKESGAGMADLLTLGTELTDANAAIFDPHQNFKGVIPGTHEILRRQGLLKGTWCLDPGEKLSAGQADEIDRVYGKYPHLNDDGFVEQFLQKHPIQED